MNGVWLSAVGWLLHCALGGGLLLLLAWGLVRRTRQPARQQRLGEWAMVAALLLAILALGPAWLVLPLPLDQRAADSQAVAPLAAPAEPAEPTGADASRLPIDPPGGQAPPVEKPRDTIPPDILRWRLSVDNSGKPSPAVIDFQVGAERTAGTLALPPAAPDCAAPAEEQSNGAGLSTTWGTLHAGLAIAYAAGAAVFLGRWLLGHLLLWRLLRAAAPAPAAAANLFAAMTAGQRRLPRLLVSRRLRVPFSCGLLRPTVVVPASLCASPERLRWVFAHELTHLERRDAWTCVLFGVGQVVYFYLPWFWWLRRQVRLCQEYVADAAAAREAAPEEYAQFLLSLTAAPAAPAAATGVTGRPSDLFRRMTMLLQRPFAVESTCPWLWTAATACGLVVLAVLGSGVGLSTETARPAEEAPRVEPTGPQQVGVQETASANEEPEKEPDRAAAQPALLAARAKALKAQELAFHLEQMDLAHRALERLAGLAPDSGPARLGIVVEPLDAALADQLNLPRDEGLVVTKVLPGLAAERVGLRPHDVLLAVDGKPVPATAREFAKLVQGLKTDLPLTVEVVRKGKQMALDGLTLPKARSARQGALKWKLPLTPSSAAGGEDVVTSVFHDKDRFTAFQQEGVLVVVVRGALVEGAPRAVEIHVVDGDAAARYEDAAAVPGPYRPRVLVLIGLADQGKANVKTKKP